MDAVNTLNIGIVIIGSLFIVVSFILYICCGSTTLPGPIKNISKGVPAVTLFFGIAALIFANSFTIIPTGYTGVKVTLGQVKEESLHKGFNPHIPIIQQIITVNNKKQDISFNDDVISSETSERNEVFFSGITVTYQINPEKSAWIYANVTNYQDGLISEALVASAIKTSSKTLSPTDVTNRSILEPIAKAEMQKSLDEKYGADVVFVNKVIIQNATFTDEYNKKLEEKQNAQTDYEKQQTENKKNIEKAEADAKVIKTQAEAAAQAKIIAAEAEAEANKKISSSVDDNVLKNKYYDKWDGKLPSTVLNKDTGVVVEMPGE